jgi:sialate O-acetylesterase
LAEFKLIILKQYFLLAVLISVTYILAGCDMPEKKKLSSETFLDLSGKWKFSIGDDSSWASTMYNDLNWEEINVPSTWENQGFHGYNGFAWYRKSFSLPADFQNSNLYLHLGFIDDVDETYVNGYLVGVSGGFPPYFLTAYSALRKYYVPNHIINRSNNLIAIRVYDTQLEGGMIKGEIGINNISQDKNWNISLDPDINLSTVWRFKTGDNLLWKEEDFDDSDWKTIFVPSFWEAQGFKWYDGFAWYRIQCYLPDLFSGVQLVLLLGKIDDIDQTYVNGKLIGSIGDWNFDTVPENFNANNEWETFRGYYVPFGVLKSGQKNTIAVRVYDGFIDGGIYDGPIGLITQERYVAYLKNKKELNQRFDSYLDLILNVN